MAGTITGVLTRIHSQQGRPQIAKLVLTCIGDAANGSFPATVLNPLAVTADGLYFDIRGLKLNSVKAIPDADTAPTDATDCTITDEYGVDLLGGKGADLIDASSKTWIPAGPGAFAIPALITGDISVNITNNDVHSGKTTLVLELVGN